MGNLEYSKGINNMLRNLAPIALRAGLQGGVEALVKNTQHDSSVAAANWKVRISGGYEPFVDFQGRSPVGEKGDKRTVEGKAFEINAVAAFKTQEQTANLSLNALKGVKVEIYNPIDEESSNYQENSKVQKTAARLEHSGSDLNREVNDFINKALRSYINGYKF